MLNIFALNVNAQQTDGMQLNSFELDTVTIASSQQAFIHMVAEITTSHRFRYRKALRRSKTSNKLYVFSDMTISETQILKHFKKAARKSPSAEGFRSYFLENDLTFINLLDWRTISSLYTTMRKTTFNGYLDDLDSIYG